MKTIEEITDPVGRRTYSPDEEIARKAPAVVCAVASRTRRLRDELAKLRVNPKREFSLQDIEQLTRDYVSPLPFENELLSGRIEQVDDAIRNFDPSQP